MIKGGAFITKRDYSSSIKQIALNSQWAAVLIDGKCFLHAIEPSMAHAGELDK